MRKIFLLSILLAGCVPVYKEEIGGTVYYKEKQCVKSHTETALSMDGKLVLVDVCDSFSIVTIKEN